MSGEQVSLASRGFDTYRTIPILVSNLVLIHNAFVFITMKEALVSIHTGPSIGVVAVISACSFVVAVSQDIHVHS